MNADEINDRWKEDVLIFCQNIYFLIKKNNLSQAEMAKLLGIGIKSLRSLEKGKIPARLSCGILLRIYESFNIYPYEMFLPLEDIPNG